VQRQDGTGAGPAPAPRIFINYRRDDASGHAGRLYDALEERFGRDRVFMDIDAIRPGDNFATVVNERVSDWDVLVAVIGRQWATIVDREGRRRLERPEDYVRIELETALNSTHTRVIPALVQGAEMPTSEQLPPEMRELSLRHAIELSDARWAADVERLVRALEGGGPPTATMPLVAPAGAGGDGPRRRGWVLPVAGVAALAVAAAAVAIVVSSGGTPGGTTATTQVASTPVTTPSHKRRPVRAVAASRSLKLAPYSGHGFQAQLPTGGGWSHPAESQPSAGLFRTTLRSSDGTVVFVDYTPREKPTFSAPFESRRHVGQAAFGSAVEYVFRSGSIPECRRWRCVDYLVDDPGTRGGFGVLVGGPAFATTRAVARDVAESLTPG
jgi:hypothetical protein